MTQSTSSLKTDIEHSFNNLFKTVDEKKWPLFIEVQKKLLHGQPLDVKTVADILETSMTKAAQMICQFGETNEDGRVVAFAGISIIPTPHSFKVNGVQLYTWCAADALIFPSFFDVAAEIESADPINGQLIKLSINKKQIDFIQPKSAYVSWIDAIDTNDIRNSMCKRVHFFVSKQTADEWQKENPIASILPAKNLFKFLINPMECC